jgi:hypothetical protein
MSEKVQCECGSVILEKSLKKHGESKKHIAYVTERREQREQREQRKSERKRHTRELRCQKRHEHRESQDGRKRLSALDYDVQEQNRMFELYAQQKQVEDKRVEKRGLPRHIVNIVMKHTDEKTCTICLDELTLQNVFMTRCGHMMCKGCEHKMYKQKNTCCPTCRSDF